MITDNQVCIFLVNLIYFYLYILFILKMMLVFKDLQAFTTPHGFWFHFDCNVCIHNRIKS